MKSNNYLFDVWKNVALNYQQGPYAVGRQRDDDGETKFVQINNYIKGFSFVMNGINLIQLEKKKCEALFSNNF